MKVGQLDLDFWHRAALASRILLNRIHLEKIGDESWAVPQLTLVRYGMFRRAKR